MWVQNVSIYQKSLTCIEALFQSTFQFYLVVEKKKNLTEKNFDGDANEPGVVNSHNHANES